MKKASKLTAMLLAFATLLTACGNGSNTSTSDASTAANAGGTDPSQATEAPEKRTDAETLVVGAPEMNGSYIDGFTNSSYDIWVRNLLGTGVNSQDLGYATYYTDHNGEYQINKTVNAEDPKRTENADGTVTYTFKIKDNLVWSDGQPITAKDYLLRIMWNASKQQADLGNTLSSGLELVGYKDFRAGKTLSFKGLRLHDDHSFSVTISKEYLPFFYEQSLVGSMPTPLHRYAEKLDIVDSEEGATFKLKEGQQVTDQDKKQLVANQQKLVDQAKKKYDDMKAEMKDAKGADGKAAYDMSKYDALEPKLDALTPEQYKKAKGDGKLADGTELAEWTDLYDLRVEQKAQEAQLKEYQDHPEKLNPTELILTESALDVYANFRTKPDVVCGPYKFVSFSNGMAQVTLNDKFVGNAEGKKPTIKNVVVQTINQDLSVDFAISGAIDITAGEVEGTKIDKAKANENAVGYVHYPRNGYGYIPMLNDRGATKYAGVRQAIAYSLDRNQFVNDICGGYGTVVSAPYGLSMWEYQEAKDDLADKLINYSLNSDAANKALDGTPYKYEKDGKTPFDPKKAQEAYNKDKEHFDYYRYDDKGNQLVVYHEGPKESTSVSNLIGNQLPNNAKLCGLHYVFNTTDFATMLTHYYTPDDNNKKAPTAFNMAVGLSIPNMPFYQYHSSQIGADNNTRVNDPELDKLLKDMIQTKPGDREAWLKKWEKWILWYNKNMPEIPLYSNDYHDIFNKRVKGMDGVTSMADWSINICDIKLEN